MRKHSRIKSVGALKAALAACVALASFGSTAQSERWFTFEVSVFSNELASDRAQELPIKKWMRRFTTALLLISLSFLIY